MVGREDPHVSVAVGLVALVAVAGCIGFVEATDDTGEPVSATGELPKPEDPSAGDLAMYPPSYEQGQRR